jgi:hypothetical protein
MLVSRDTAAWRVMLPSWAGLVFESKGLRLRINSKTPESRAVADSTMGFIGTIRDISNDTHSLFGRLFRQAKYVLEQQGAELVHPPMPASERPDPKTGEHE